MHHWQHNIQGLNPQGLNPQGAFSDRQSGESVLLAQPCHPARLVNVTLGDLWARRGVPATFSAPVKWAPASSNLLLDIIMYDQNMGQALNRILGTAILHRVGCGQFRVLKVHNHFFFSLVKFPFFRF